VGTEAYSKLRSNPKSTFLVAHTVAVQFDRHDLQQKVLERANRPRPLPDVGKEPGLTKLPGKGWIELPQCPMTQAKYCSSNCTQSKTLAGKLASAGDLVAVDVASVVRHAD
jgi:hypothetical protein